MLRVRIYVDLRDYRRRDDGSTSYPIFGGWWNPRRRRWSAEVAREVEVILHLCTIFSAGKTQTNIGLEKNVLERKEKPDRKKKGLICIFHD